LLSDQSAEFYDNVTLNATKKLIFDADGDSDTYIYESSEDVLAMVAGGNTAMVLDGNSNISLGNNDSGTANTLFGFDAGDALASGSYYNAFIGTLAGYSVSTGDRNTALGYHAIRLATSSSDNTAVGCQAGDTITTGAENTYIGAGADASSNSVNNEMALGNDAVGQGANTIMLGDSNITGLYCYDTSISSPSDSRIKRDISDADCGLDLINSLRPVSYKRVNPFDYPEGIKPAVYQDENAERPQDNNRVYADLIAQEVEQVMENAGYDFRLVDTTPNGMKAVNYGTLIMPLIKAVQELTARLEAVENK